MRFPASTAVLVASLAGAHAQFLVNDLSFGYGSRIREPGEPWIPNFSIQGAPTVPELLSNKVILTPPAPGNHRGSIWSDKQLAQLQWTADVEFRANGPDLGGGNMQIWLVRDGPRTVGTASIYTVEKFEGLSLVIDQQGEYRGMVRGFLNDGTTDYKKSTVDKLSFGHWNFPYRNLGRPSQVKLRHTNDIFRVEVDGVLCFESDKVRIPPGYHLGITAASADNPDSFEVFKLVVLTEDQHKAESGHFDKKQEKAAQQDIPKPASGQTVISADDPFGDSIPDEAAEKFTSSAAQFSDLHGRLQSVNHHLSTIFRSLATANQVGEKRHEETSSFLGELRGRLYVLDKLDKLDKIDQLEQKVVNLERELHKMRDALSRTVRDSEKAVKNFVVDKHDTMQEELKAQAPGHTRLILVIIGSQMLLVAAFVMYKRRKSSPKKYL